MNEITLIRPSSPKFHHQRMIAYVDNPFDEQASSCMQSCDLKYMQTSPSDDKRHGRKAPTDPAGTSFNGDVTSDQKNVYGEISWGVHRRDEYCENDWSCLFLPIQCHSNSPSGEIQLSLSYDPFLGTLKVAIIKARALTCPICARKPRNSGIICVGTFVRISLFANNKQLATKKTVMKTRKAEIFFYDAFSFLVHNGMMGRCSLQCRAVHKVGSILKRDHVIGQVLIGGENTCDDDAGLRHWNEMIEKPRTNITQWYYLKED